METEMNDIVIFEAENGEIDGGLAYFILVIIQIFQRLTLSRQTMLQKIGHTMVL